MGRILTSGDGSSVPVALFSGAICRAGGFYSVVMGTFTTCRTPSMADASGRRRQRREARCGKRGGDIDRHTR